ADKIAASLGIEKTSPERARAGVLHALGELTEEGHVYAPRAILLERARILLEIEDAIIETAIDALAESTELIIEEDSVYKRALYEAERRSAERLLRLATSEKRKIEIDIDKALA